MPLSWPNLRAIFSAPSLASRPVSCRRTRCPGPRARTAWRPALLQRHLVVVGGVDQLGDLVLQRRHQLGVVVAQRVDGDAARPSRYVGPRCPRPSSLGRATARSAGGRRCSSHGASGDVTARRAPGRSWSFRDLGTRKVAGADPSVTRRPRRILKGVPKWPRTSVRASPGPHDACCDATSPRHNACHRVRRRQPPASAGRTPAGTRPRDAPMTPSKPASSTSRA
jgi:hypothetical protein